MVNNFINKIRKKKAGILLANNLLDKRLSSVVADMIQASRPYDITLKYNDNTRIKVSGNKNLGFDYRDGRMDMHIDIDRMKRLQHMDIGYKINKHAGLILSYDNGKKFNAYYEYTF